VTYLVSVNEFPDIVNLLDAICFTAIGLQFFKNVTDCARKGHVKVTLSYNVIILNVGAFWPIKIKFN
jgi:hypothetical protein